MSPKKQNNEYGDKVQFDYFEMHTNCIAVSFLPSFTAKQCIANKSMDRLAKTQSDIIMSFSILTTVTVFIGGKRFEEIRHPESFTYTQLCFTVTVTMSWAIVLTHWNTEKTLIAILFTSNRNTSTEFFFCKFECQTFEYPTNHGDNLVLIKVQYLKSTCNSETQKFI